MGEELRTILEKNEIIFRSDYILVNFHSKNISNSTRNIALFIRSDIPLFRALLDQYNILLHIDKPSF